MSSSLLGRIFSHGEETDAEKKERAEARETLRKWAEILKRPAHEYLVRFLKDAGLPTNRPLVGATCSFFVKKPEEYWAIPCQTSIIGVSSLGMLHLDLLSGPYGQPATLIYYKNEGWKLVQDGVSKVPVVNFELL